MAFLCTKKYLVKRFEDNIKVSCPKRLLVYRPPDAAQSFNMTSKLRFSQHSPADFFFFNGEKCSVSSIGLSPITISVFPSNIGLTNFSISSAQY